MTKQFLLYLNVCAVLVEQSRVRVPKCMPTKSPNSDQSEIHVALTRSVRELLADGSGEVLWARFGQLE